MLMRYHWGLAVGHVYSHQQEFAAHVEEHQHDFAGMPSAEEDLTSSSGMHITSGDNNDSDSDDPQHCLHDLENELDDEMGSSSDIDNCDSDDSEGDLMEALGMVDLDARGGENGDPTLT